MGIAACFRAGLHQQPSSFSQYSIGTEQQGTVAVVEYSKEKEGCRHNLFGKQIPYVYPKISYKATHGRPETVAHSLRGTMLSWRELLHAKRLQQCLRAAGSDKNGVWLRLQATEAYHKFDLNDQNLAIKVLYAIMGVKSVDWPLTVRSVWPVRTKPEAVLCIIPPSSDGFDLAQSVLIGWGEEERERRRERASERDCSGCAEFVSHRLLSRLHAKIELVELNKRAMTAHVGRS
ncbi:MAG: hypothetical protein FRX49_07568 [Trebouxia sp. A1-2]|nr:MAG: hypothetical protein FRX49_07568 [Trebouxia sp. A1-2]